MFLFYFIYLFYEEILTFTESRTSEIKSGRNRILPERFILLRRRRCFVRNLRTLIRFVLKSLLLKTNHRLVTNSIDLRSICGACVQFWALERQWEAVKLQRYAEEEEDEAMLRLLLLLLLIHGLLSAPLCFRYVLYSFSTLIILILCFAIWFDGELFVYIGEWRIWVVYIGKSLVLLFISFCFAFNCCWLYWPRLIFFGDLISDGFLCVLLCCWILISVGNIPYDATEEQLIEICQEAGPVVSFRSVFYALFSWETNPKIYILLKFGS